MIFCFIYASLGTASGNQWARCMSKDRLRNVTNGSLTCIFNYCNYLCMQEYYDLSAGEIYSDCQCTSDDLNRVDKSRPIIEDSCYKPNTSDCVWFDRCFARRYPSCTEADNRVTKNMLFVEFEKKFCGLLSQDMHYLSDLARQWLIKVNKCFFDRLVPLIRPWQNEVCDSLENNALDSFRQCYFKPDLNFVISICQLDCKSWWLIFRDMKNFFGMGNHKWSRILNQYFKFGVKGRLNFLFFVIKFNNKSKFLNVFFL